MGFTFSCCLPHRSTGIIPVSTLKSDFQIRESPSKEIFNTSTMFNRDIIKPHQSGNLFSIRLIQTNFKTKPNVKSNHLQCLCDSPRSIYKRSNTHIDVVKDYKNNVEYRLNNFSRRSGIIPITRTDDIHVKHNDTINSPVDDLDLDLTPKSVQHEQNEQTCSSKIYETSNNDIESSNEQQHHYTSFIKTENSFFAQKKVNFKKVRTKKTYRIISEELSDMQLQYIKKILCDEEMIIKEMDDKTINRILNTITYIRVKADTTLYYNKKILTSSGAVTPSSMIHCNDMKTPFEKEHCYYIIEKGKIELTIDNNKYHIERDGSISTKAILKNTQEECKLTTLKRVYLYKMPIEKYISIFNEFVDNLIDEKVTMFKRNYIFALSETHHLIQLANVCPKLTHDNKALLIEESKIPEALYIIVSGRVSCYKSGKLLHILTENDVLGELGLFTQYESNFDYYAEPGCVVIEIMYHVINDIFCENDNPIQKMVHNVFRNAIKTSRVLSKYFSDDNYLNIFETFQLKYYFNDTLSNKKIRKVYMHLAGILTETKNEQNKDITPKGQFVEEEITCDNNQINKYTLFSEECLVLESSWLELTKNMFPYSDKGISFYDKMFFLKRLKSLKDINEFKLFSLAESLRYKTYQENTLIIHLNKTPNELFIIKTGHVKIEINDVVVKVLGPGNYFGNMITPFHKEHSNDVSYIAKTNVEIYSLKKEDYDEVMDWEILKPFNKILIKDNKININELYYIKELGQGSYGKVYLVHNKEKYFAVKTADIQAMDQSEDKGRCYLNEKSIMSSIEHPFIVQLINTFKTSEYIFFIIEYIKGITLRDYMNEYQDHLRDIPETTFIAALLCSIITYLQKKRIIHRDLKPDNLMIDSVTGYVKAIDFGAAKNLSGKDSTYTVIGTPQYMAPEALGGSGSCCSTDIWSVGVILYECFYGTLPYGNGSSNPVELYGEIKGNEIVFPSDPRNNKVNVFLKKLLTKDPEKRMNEFSLWKNYTLFSDLDFELLNKKLFISPLLDKLKMSSNVKHEMGCELSNHIASQNEQKEDLKNISCPFHLFMKNTLFSLNDLEFSTLIRTRTDYSYNDF